MQSRVAEAPTAASADRQGPARSGFGVYVPERGAGPDAGATVANPSPGLLPGVVAWTPETIVLVSVVWTSFLSILGLLATVLKWKYQISLWAALLGALVALFLFFLKRRRNEEDEKELAGTGGRPRPAT